jgi:periplasmic protein TonB
MQDVAYVAPAPAEPIPALDVPLVRDLTWYPARQLDVFPRALATPRPAYPAAAQSLQGEVTLLLLIDEAGTVHEVSVVEAQPPGMFDEAASVAFRDVHFEPAMKDGRAVRSRILVKVAFNPDPPERDSQSERR